MCQTSRLQGSTYVVLIGHTGAQHPRQAYVPAMLKYEQLFQSEHALAPIGMTLLSITVCTTRPYVGIMSRRNQCALLCWSDDSRRHVRA